MVQDEFLCPFGRVNYIVLLKIPVITTQTRAPSQGRCLVQYFNVLNCFLTPLHDLKIPCSIEEKGTPGHEGPCSIVLHGNDSDGDLFVMQIVLEIIKTIQVNILLRSRLIFFSDRLCLMVPEL